MKTALCLVLSAFLVGSGDVSSVKNSVAPSPVPEETTTYLGDAEVQSLVSAGIGQRVGKRLASEKKLVVNSTQKVSFVQLPSSGQQDQLCEPKEAIKVSDATSVSVRVTSEMTQTSMKTTFQKDGSEQPDLILELLVHNGVPMCRETHWYTEQKGYLEGTPYPIVDRSGVDELRTEHSIFASIQAKGVPVCALAEFYFTWLGQNSTQIRFFRDVMLGNASFVRKETRDGNLVYHLVRIRWDDKDERSHGICKDHFWVTSDFRLVAWDSEFTDAQFGNYVSYMVVERAYTYSN